MRLREVGRQATAFLSWLRAGGSMVCLLLAIAVLVEPIDVVRRITMAATQMSSSAPTPEESESGDSQATKLSIHQGRRVTSKLTSPKAVPAVHQESSPELDAPNLIARPAYHHRTLPHGATVPMRC